MTESVRQPTGVVTVNDEPLFLAKDAKGVPQWHPRQIQTQEGDPTRPRRTRWQDWSRGLGDSRGIFRGSIEHCSQAFLGSLGRILPSHAIGVIQTNCSAPIVTFEEVTLPAPRILCGGGVTIAEVNSAHAVATTQTFPGGTIGPMALFIDQVAIPLGDSQQFYRRTAAGAYAVSTTTVVTNPTTGHIDDYRYARAFGLAGNRDGESTLVRGRAAYWSRCASADFYATNGNWSTEYRVGDPTGMIQQVFSHNRWDYVLKDEGLYTFDEADSQESNVLSDLRAFKSGENRYWAPWHDQLLVCTLAGLYRYLQQGAARTTGTEELEVNEAVLRNTFPTSAVAYGRWAYVAFFDGTTSYLTMCRKGMDGDATFGVPLTVVCVIAQFAGRCNAMIITGITGSPELWFALDTDVGWFQLTRDGRPAAFATGTTRVEFAPSDLGSPMTLKYARGLEFVGRNVDPARFLQWEAAFDDGGFNDVGAPVVSLTNGFGQRFWTAGANDSGRVIQLALEMQNNNTLTPPEVRDVILNYEERPFLTEGAVLAFRFRDEDAEGDVATRKSAKEQREFVQALCDGAPALITDPYGDTWRAAFAQFEGAADWTYSGYQPQEHVQLTVRKLEYA